MNEFSFDDGDDFFDSSMLGGKNRSSRRQHVGNTFLTQMDFTRPAQQRIWKPAANEATEAVVDYGAMAAEGAKPKEWISRDQMVRKTLPPQPNRQPPTILSFQILFHDGFSFMVRNEIKNRKS